MRSKRALFNTSAAAMMQIVTFIIGLILPRLIIEGYGSELNGLRASISQFISYLYIIELGVGGAIIYSLYRPITENNTDKINAILSAGKRSYKQIGIYFTGLVILMMALYPLVVMSENITYVEIAVLVIAIGASGIINYFTAAKYNVLLVASQLDYVVSIIRVIYLLTNTSIMLLCIHLKWDLSFVYLTSLVANIIQVSLTTLYTRHKYKNIDFKVEPDNEALAKRYDVIIHQISGMVVFGSPIILLTLFTTLIEVSVYSIYALIFTGVNMIMSIFNSGFTAGFGQLIAKGHGEKLKNAYNHYEFLYYMILTFVYSCVLVLGIPFLKIYTKGISDVDYIDITILVLFVIVGIMNNWKIPQSTIIVSAGHFKETRHRAIIEATLTLIASSVLALIFGLKGVILGSIVGLGYRSIDIIYALKLVGVSYKTTFKRLIRILLIGSLSIMPILLFVEIKPDNLIQWIRDAIFVSLWIGFCVFGINYIFEPKTIHEIFKRLKGIFGYGK